MLAVPSTPTVTATVPVLNVTKTATPTAPIVTTPAVTTPVAVPMVASTFSSQAPQPALAPLPSALEAETLEFDFGDTQLASVSSPPSVDESLSGWNVETIFSATSPSLLGERQVTANDASDLGELVSPARTAGAPAAPRRMTREKLAGILTTGAGMLTPADQEALLSRFALEEGVVGVLLSDRLGKVYSSRMEGNASHLASVTAATVFLLLKDRPLHVFYCQMGQANVFIAPFKTLTLTVLADAHVNVGRVLAEVNAVKEGL
jgi:hypothetical protein